MNNYILIGILLFLLLIIIIIFFIKNNKIEKFSEPNIYLSDEETIKFLDADEDKYIQNMSP